MAKVMLIEDDVSMVYLLKTLLNLEGFDVCPQVDLGDIIGSIRAENPDLLLMDIHLVGINGLDLLRKIRTFDDMKNVIVIMSSGMYLEKEAMDAGANAFMLKPFMPDDLIQLIRKNLASQAK
jgi:DNA-binding response OmpR family regulator